jgi:peptidoglycan/LPS O-acetylase OafA/YrhL
LGGYNIGVPAVVVFYAISGYVVRALVSRYHTRPERIPAFYGERFLRLAPQYLIYVVAGAVLWAAGTQSPFLAREPGLWEWLANAIVVPLNWYMFNGLDAFTLVPPAWSLGCEIQFYLLAPWVWLAPERVRLALFLGSLGIYVFAVVGVFHTDWLGYRLLPGVLWIFLAGGLLQERVATARGILAVLWLAHAVLLALLLARPALQSPFNVEVAAGIVVGLPVLALLSRARPRAWDTALGNLSYGLFLAHFAVLWAWALWLRDGHAVPPLPLYLGIALALAAASWWLGERPVARLRRRWFRSQRT